MNTEPATRVLSVVRDTDRTNAHLSALDLHVALDAAGFELRTVALGPGRVGGLDHLLPVLSPSSGSAAASLQLRRELPWADVVVCHGVEAARVQRRAGIGRRRPVAVAVHPRGPGNPQDPLSPAVADWAVVVTSASPADAPDGVVAAGVGIDAGVVGDPVDGRRRAAARDAMGLPADGPVLWWTGSPNDRSLELLRAAADARGWPVVSGGGADDDLVVAASDVAVFDATAADGHPRELLRAAASGHALVAHGWIAGGDLVDAATGAPMPGDGPESFDESLEMVLDAVAGADARASMAVAASDRVRNTHPLQRVIETWTDVLRALSAS